MKKILLVGVIASLLAGCSTEASRMAECENKGVSRDACYQAEASHKAAINGAAMAAAFANARDAVNRDESGANKEFRTHHNKHNESYDDEDSDQYGQGSHKPVKHDSNYKQVTTEADAVMNGTIKDGADFLLSQGWKPNNGVWKKKGYILKLVVEDGIIVNAQVSK